MGLLAQAAGQSGTAHIKEKVNGCWKMGGERETISWQESPSEHPKHHAGIISMPEQPASPAYKNTDSRDQ